MKYILRDSGINVKNQTSDKPQTMWVICQLLPVIRQGSLNSVVNAVWIPRRAVCKEVLVIDDDV